ncbi:MAG: carboxyl transferase domain-containing protein [Chloroflexota bacterium]
MDQLVDPGTFIEEDSSIVSSDPLGFVDSHSYQERIGKARKSTGLSEAVVVGSAKLTGHAVYIGVFDFSFLGGSMGIAVGERLVRLFERATKWKKPVLIITSSGGARLQEGTLALSQMARVAAAVERYRSVSQPFISVLADPTTGGVMVSPASLADAVFAEPGAFAAFAGSRVSGEVIPIKAEWLLSHGMVDAVIARHEMRDSLALAIQILTRRNRSFRRLAPAAHPVPDHRGTGTPPNLPGAWERVKTVRRSDRPSSLGYIARMTTDFVELAGDKLYADDGAVVGGVGTLEGRSVVFIGHERSRPANARQPAGKPYPEGFRKALRLASLAAKFNFPVVTLIDTPGAQADADAEARGLSFAIGRCLRVFSILPVPVIAAIIGEGCSGAAIALAVADRVLMQENAIYEVISPEGAGLILYGDAQRAPEIAPQMGVTAPEALALGVVDEIVAEPAGGTHTDPALAARLLSLSLTSAIAESQRWLPKRLLQKRYVRLQSIGAEYLQTKPSETRGFAIPAVHGIGTLRRQITQRPIVEL